MHTFSLVNTWIVAAPIERCWFCLLEREQWPHWWRYVDKIEPITQGDCNGIGNQCRIYWHTCLPYRLTVDILTLKLEPFRYINYSVAGDLNGNGRCSFKSKRRETRITFEWNVSPSKPWMQHLLPYASSIFIWNHQQVMNNGELSFKHRLNVNP